jgi:hypothetical protein
MKLTEKEKARIVEIQKEVKGVHSSAFAGWDKQIKFLLKIALKGITK